MRLWLVATMVLIASACTAPGLIKAPTVPSNEPVAGMTATANAGARSPATRVLRVIDGDTIEVVLSGKRDTVRIIGIDTPEVVDPHRVVQCFALEASTQPKPNVTNTAASSATSEKTMVWTLACG